MSECTRNEILELQLSVKSWRDEADKWRRKAFAIVHALEQARDYFDNRADADCDQDGFIPNQEMRLLSEIDAALKLAEGQP